MGTELPTTVMLGQTLVLMQMPFLNNVRKVGRLVLSRTCCCYYYYYYYCNSTIIIIIRCTRDGDGRSKFLVSKFQSWQTNRIVKFLTTLCYRLTSKLITHVPGWKE
jgi:hypothetical protein